MKRKIITFDHDKCNGCGICIPACPEGAIQLIDSKARLVSDLFCDGLGACLKTCPQNAILVEEREAKPYDEEKVMENIVKQGENTLKAHLEHLKSHGEEAYLKTALDFLSKNNIPNPLATEVHKAEHAHGMNGCPGSRMLDYTNKGPEEENNTSGTRSSQLRQWPVQLHLVSPNAPYFKKRDVLLAADCVAYTLGDFHKDFLKDKSLAIACPKLDEGMEIYLEKLKHMIEDAQINTLTVMIMEVPCCNGLLQLALEAREQSKRKIPVKKILVGLKGEILEEEWL